MIMQELGLLEDFLKLPHSEIRAFAVEIGGTRFKVADFAHVPTPCKFIALMPQWDFLNFLAGKGAAPSRLADHDVGAGHGL